LASAARPGARGESLEQYVKRLRDLEQIATRHEGVDKVYAMQAGREIRVIVEPTAIDDDAAMLLSREIAREIAAFLWAIARLIEPPPLPGVAA